MREVLYTFPVVLLLIPFRVKWNLSISVLGPFSVILQLRNFHNVKFIEDTTSAQRQQEKSQKYFIFQLLARIVIIQICEVLLVLKIFKLGTFLAHLVYFIIYLTFQNFSSCLPHKIGIKCFSRFLLVAHGRKPSNPHFHGPIRQRISEEDRRNV